MSNCVALYERLGVPSTASTSQIKKAFMQLARQYHPDKNPDAGDIFKEISQAYEILSNEQKRKIYDTYGEKAIKDGVHQRPEDAFPSMFPQQQGPSITHQLRLNLEDVYNGRQLAIEMKRAVNCVDCNGRGGALEAQQPCGLCNSTGVRITRRQLPGTSIFQQLRQTCKDCAGQGHVIPPNLRCGTCRGLKTRLENHKFDVYIDKGMKNRQKILFQGEGDQGGPNHIPGDVIFQIDLVPHSVFRTEGKDLHMDMEISLVEALTGFSVPLIHMDGRTLSICSEGIIRPGDVRAVVGEGMPEYKNPFEKGVLFIHFSVKFPTYPLSPQQVSLLKQALPSTSRTIPQSSSSEPEEVVHLVEYKSSGAQTTSHSFLEEDVVDEPINCVQQ